MEALPSITCEDHAFTVVFHPEEQILACSFVTGHIKFYAFDMDAKTVELVEERYRPHKKSCRLLAFEKAGSWIASAGSDGRLVVSNMDPKSIWSSEMIESGISALAVSTETSGLVASGDDDGVVRLYDIRDKARRTPAIEFSEQMDYISSLSFLDNDQTILSTSGDRTLASLDLRKNKKCLGAMSDEQEDEILSCAIVLDGKKVLTGDSAGIIGVWKNGFWGDIKDRIVDLKGISSIDCMRKISEDRVLVGGSDGIIRELSLYPNNNFSSIIGYHDNNAQIESLAIDLDLKLVASVAHDSIVRFWGIPEKEAKVNVKKVVKLPPVKTAKAAEKQSFFMDL